MGAFLFISFIYHSPPQESGKSLVIRIGAIFAKTSLSKYDMNPIK